MASAAKSMKQVFVSIYEQYKLSGYFIILIIDFFIIWLYITWLYGCKL